MYPYPRLSWVEPAAAVLMTSTVTNIDVITTVTHSHRARVSQGSVHCEWKMQNELERQVGPGLQY